MSVSRSLKLAVLGCAILAPVVLGGCDRQSGEKAQPQASASAAPKAAGLAGTIDRRRKGSPLPDFTLTDASGKSVKLATFKGKPLLVNLWATWCAPCVIELPMLDELAGERAGDLKVLTVSQDMESSAAKVAPFLAGKGVRHLEPWLDPKNDLAFHYEAQTLPTTIYYDAKGQEVWRYVGGHDWTSAETAKMLAEAE